MKTSPQSFSSELVRRVVHFLWRQWGQIGLASVSVEPRDGWAVDPEALWLLSATYARHDPRLFDEIMDWLSRNANFVNVPRLKSVLRRYEFVGEHVVAAMAARVMEENQRLHWRFPAPHGDVDAQPLFLNADGTPMPKFGAPDPGFLKNGFRRGKVELRGLSRSFNPVMPECALLRLRALFGVSARADIMLYLLTHDVAHPSGIARETGFSQKNVQDTLVAMAASTVVNTVQFAGRMKHYFVLKDERPRFLYHSDKLGLMPRWVTWPPLFRALELLLDETRGMATKPLSESLLASELRRVAGLVRPLAQQAGLAESFSEASRITGAAYAAAFMEETDAWLAGALGERRRAESGG